MKKLLLGLYLLSLTTISTHAADSILESEYSSHPQMGPVFLAAENLDGIKGLTQQRLNLNFQNSQLIEVNEALKATNAVLLKLAEVGIKLKTTSIELCNGFLISPIERHASLSFFNTLKEGVSAILEHHTILDDVAVLNHAAPGYSYSIRKLRDGTQFQDEIVDSVTFPTLHDAFQNLVNSNPFDSLDTTTMRKTQDMVDALNTLITSSIESCTEKSQLTLDKLKLNLNKIEELSALINVKINHQRNFLDQIEAFTND